MCAKMILKVRVGLQDEWFKLQDSDAQAHANNGAGLFCFR
jgi:hypothetical protein